MHPRRPGLFVQEGRSTRQLGRGCRNLSQGQQEIASILAQGAHLSELAGLGFMVWGVASYYSRSQKVGT